MYTILTEEKQRGEWLERCKGAQSPTAIASAANRVVNKGRQVGWGKAQGTALAQLSWDPRSALDTLC